MGLWWEVLLEIWFLPLHLFIIKVINII